MMLGHDMGTKQILIKAWAKFSDSGPYFVTTAVFVYGVAAWADAADEAQDRSYRY